MSQTTKKMMSLDLEFIDPTAHGFINWVDYTTGEQLATLGLGSTAMDIGYDDEGETVGIDNGGQKYLEWNLSGVDYIKVVGGGIQFDEQRSLSIDSTHDIITTDEYGIETITPTAYISSQIQLNSPDYTDIEKANVIHISDMQDVSGEGVLEEQNEELIRLNDIKEEYANNTNAMILEHEKAIVFSNPISERLMGEIDMVNEAFVWYGAFSLGSVVEDALFEIKRTSLEKYNFSINADVDNIPEIVFKKEDVVVWSMSVDTNLILKNTTGNGIEIKETEVEFTDDIRYKTVLLDDYFYEQSIADSKFVNVTGDIMTGSLTSVEFIGPLTGNSSTTSKFKTARSITLSGDVTGMVSFDGSSNVSINTVVDYTHNHDDSYYTKVEIDSKPNILPIIELEDDLPENAVLGQTCLLDDDFPKMFIFTSQGWKSLSLI